jgi:hypothetical protein
MTLARERLTRTVPANEWRVSDTLGLRTTRLLDVPNPHVLLEQTLADANRAAAAGLVRVAWKPSDERPGYFRTIAQIPLSETTFDQFFNGRSGYRAQYYISPEEGILFNRDVVIGLLNPLRVAFQSAPLTTEWDLLERSVCAPHSKVWVFDEQRAFDQAAPDTINPTRWIANQATRGRKAPLPEHFMLDVKGAFIHPVTKDLFVDELKLDRAWDIFKRGYT